MFGVEMEMDGCMIPGVKKGRFLEIDDSFQRTIHDSSPPVESADSLFHDLEDQSHTKGQSSDWTAELQICRTGGPIQPRGRTLILPPI